MVYLSRRKYAYLLYLLCGVFFLFYSAIWGIDNSRLVSYIEQMSELILDIDEIIRRNLRRILDEKKLKQNGLAKKIGVAPSVINDILTGNKNMGKDIMSRICDALKIDPWQFMVTNVAPILTDAKDSYLLSIMRDAEALGVAEDIVRYGKYIIEEAKKKSSATGKDASPRVKRTHKRAS